MHNCHNLGGNSWVLPSMKPYSHLRVHVLQSAARVYTLVSSDRIVPLANSHCSILWPIQEHVSDHYREVPLYYHVFPSNTVMFWYLHSRVLSCTYMTLYHCCMYSSVNVCHFRSHDVFYHCVCFHGNLDTKS